MGRKHRKRSHKRVAKQSARNLRNSPLMLNLKDSVVDWVDPRCFDCSLESGRAVCFDALSRGELHLHYLKPFSQNKLPICADVPIPITNTLAFGILMHHEHVKRLLSSIVCKHLIPKRLDLHLEFVCHVMLDNRLIYRHIFKERQYGLWEPLLSALMKALWQRSVSDLEDVRYRALSVSIQNLEADQFVFALQQGLFDFAAYHAIADNGHVDGSEIASIHQVGIHMLYETLYYRSKLDLTSVHEDPETDETVVRALDGMMDFMRNEGSRGRQTLFRSILQNKPFRNRLQGERAMHSVCGWPPCEEEMVKNADYRCMPRVWTCKRCRLIKYCCRNHQKKHWKFIHSQQCRKY